MLSWLYSGSPRNIESFRVPPLDKVNMDDVSSNGPKDSLVALDEMNLPVPRISTLKEAQDSIKLAKKRLERKNSKGKGNSLNMV